MLPMGQHRCAHFRPGRCPMFRSTVPDKTAVLTNTTGQSPVQGAWKRLGGEVLDPFDACLCRNGRTRSTVSPPNPTAAGEQERPAHRIE